MRTHRITALFCAALLLLAPAFPASAAEPHTVHVTLSTPAEVFVEGARVDFMVSSEGKYPPFSYDGAMYIPLMTVGRWLGADTVWDEKAGTVTITSNGAAPVYDTVTELLANDVGFIWGGDRYDKDRTNGVEAQLLSNVTVTVNGMAHPLVNAGGGLACPLLIRGFIYLPLESVGQLMGKQVVYSGGNVYLYQTSPENELAGAVDSLAAVRDHLEAVRAIVTGAEPKTEEEFTAKAKEVQGHLIAACELPTPDVPGLQHDWAEVKFWLEWTLTKLVDGYLPPEESSGMAEAQGEQPSRPWFLSDPLTTVKDKWEGFSGGIVPAPGYTSYFLYAEGQCTQAEGILSAIRQSSAHSPAAGEPAPVTEDIPTSGVAYASTQPVLIDGRAIEFRCYALRDADGNPTNYVKLRDVAWVLNNTAARFSVGWDGAVSMETGKEYIPNGSEMTAPFTGDRNYEKAVGETRINGMASDIDAIVLTDDQGGAYTYYKLRDLGAALGFQVDWSAEAGIFIETE